MAGYDYRKCDCELEDERRSGFMRRGKIPPHLRSTKKSEEEQYRQFVKELDLAIRGFPPKDEGDTRTKLFQCLIQVLAFICSPFGGLMRIMKHKFFQLLGYV